MKLKLNEVLDYTPFLRKLTLFYIRIPKPETAKWRDRLGPLLLRERGIPPIDNKPKDCNKIYLKPDVSKEEVASLQPDLPPLETESVQATLDASDYKDLLAQLLPPEVVVPTSFESLGHIAFLNLRAPHQEYQYTIGRVILDTHPAFKTIVSKSEKLNNVFRTPVLDLIAGVRELETEIKEEKTRFLLDVEKVYFCSRLHYERSRVLALVSPGEVVADVFCGIGPFSIRAANERRAICYANDLNPECFRYLKENIKRNKVGSRVTPFCMDGRDFFRHIFGLVDGGQLKRVDHFYLNLPAIGVDFLDVFNEGAFRKWQFPFQIHATCFEAISDDEAGTLELVKTRLRSILAGCLDAFDFGHFQFIKNVSKSKAMICVTLKFRAATPEVGGPAEGGKGPRAKRVKE